MKKTLLLCTFFIVGTLSAQDWYRTDKKLSLGDSYSLDNYSMKHVSCTVKGQLQMGSGSAPILVNIGYERCGVAFKGFLEEDDDIVVFLNGDTSVINCMVCKRLGN